MFSKDRSQKIPSNLKPIKDLIATEDPNIAIQDNKYKKLISNIKSSIGFNNTEFELHVIPLILKTFKYCQKLPESSMYYANLGGLVDLAINRAEAALGLMRNILVIEDNKPPSEEQKLWLYAMFSAALLQGLGKLYTDYKINLFDKNGQYIKCWQPLLESFVSISDYYDYDLLRGDDYDLRNSITPLIARRIMPKSGFEKILSASEVFATWLALLREDKDSAGPLAAILDRANAIAMQRYLNSFIEKFGLQEGRGNRLGTFIDNKQENSPEKELLIGAEFLAWLNESLKTGKIILNQPPFMIEVKEASVILHPEVLDVFMQEHKKLKNRVAIQKSFLAWNMHLLTDAAKETISQNNKNNQTKIELNKAILPDNVKIYDAHTKKIASVSSLNLVHNIHNYNQNNKINLSSSIEKLSTAGKWVSGEQNVTNLQHQSTHKV
ncbi:MAG: hypothetical protein A3E88_01970 [Legionellales bacterium RIFCSPHIGHO2_12_FULL_35_11]|nr:MAG: hypothetical protein A3E88_01970 [Legionellales bacterium RIFCSPHIGHO2_12_FULL_35_11]